MNLLLVKQNDEENVVDEDTHQGRYRRGVKRLRGVCNGDLCTNEECKF